MSDIPSIRLVAARVNAGMNQDDVASELGVSKATIVSWEYGKTEPTISQARHMARLFNFPLDKIIFSIDESISN